MSKEIAIETLISLIIWSLEYKTSSKLDIYLTAKAVGWELDFGNIDNSLKGLREHLYKCNSENMIHYSIIYLNRYEQP